MCDHIRRVVPWKNRNEFECVYNEIFGDDVQLQTHAVGRIDVWRSRALHKIPVAIDSTAAIVHAKLFHQMAVKAKQGRQQDNEIRSSYSLALIRFVNHITEKGQIGEFAQPVHVLANKVGVPEWIVDLRHDATHRHLPPLPMLVSACNWALSWLKNEFWQKQLTSTARKLDQENTDTPANKMNVRGLLVKYQEQRFEKMNKDNSWKVVQDMENLPREYRQELVKCLVDGGFIIPTQELLQALRIQPAQFEKPGNTIPHLIVTFWKPVLQFIHQSNLTDRLLMKMASDITTKACVQNYTLCRWINTIITANEQAGDKNTSRSTTKLYKQYAPLAVRPLLRSLLYNQCGHTIPLIRRLLDTGKRAGEFTQTQVNLFNKLIKKSSPKEESISTTDGEYKQQDETLDGGNRDLDQTLSTDGQAGEVDLTLHLVQDSPEHTTSPVQQRETAGCKSIYKLEDLKSRKRKLETSEVNIPAKCSSFSFGQPDWHLCEDGVDWSQIPIGILPQQSLDFMALDLSSITEESFSTLSNSIEEDDDDFDKTCEEETTEEKMICYEETCHQDELLFPSSFWTSLQMTKIKQGVQLLC
ncbi:ribosomal biogenesis protein LAS1L-like [Argopecten irradians]|uniref:ribosomal biogenesis protein LAS1L-like n=1 Tax=Argopecten irradians TaxID=31199 RepID=UPI0037111342